MRRLPGELMLDLRLRDRAAVSREDMIRIAAHLASSHLALPACNHDEGYSDLMHVRRNWDENFRQVSGFVGSAVSPEGFGALKDYVTGFLEDHDGEIDARERSGWVRECHGDLHAEHICLTDPLRIYDCIEFNRRFRVSDILADTAFLLMDIDRRGRPDLSSELWRAYRQKMGAPLPEGLLCFYKVYRAYVRAKVAAITAEETAAGEARLGLLEKALGYFSLALGYTFRPSLLITCGLMGTGKSRVASALAASLRAEWIRSDVIRQGFKQSAEEGMQAGFLTGPYRKETTEEVYRIMAEKARERLMEGCSVILDAGFGDPLHRRNMQDLAAELGVPFGVLHLVCPRDIALERLRCRALEGRDASDGRVEIYDLQKAHFQAPSANEPVVEADTSGSVDYIANSALGRLARLWG
jgi:predicted kinase